MALLERPSPRTTGVPPLRRLRIATVLLVSSFTVLVIAASANNLIQQYRVAVETAVRTARGEASAVESHAVQAFGETYRIIDGIADVYSHELEHAKLQGGVIDEVYLHKLMAEKLALVPSVQSFFVLDENFQGVAGSRSFPVDITRVTLTGMAFDSLVDIGGGFVLGELYRNIRGDASPENWLLPLGVRIEDAAGRPRGFVFALVVTRHFSDHYTKLDVGAHGRIAMWTREGRLMAANSGDTAAIGDIGEPQRLAAPEAGLGSPDTVTVIGEKLAREVVAHNPVGDLPLSVSVTLDARDFLASWREAIESVVLSAGAALLVMAVFGAIVFRQIAQTEKSKSALHQAKAMADDANEAKSRFLAHMSHEFRTPLNAIMGFAEIIKNKILGDHISPAYVSYADHIHRSGEHLLNIVNDILDMARIESGAQPLQREALDIRDVVLAAASFVEGLAAQRGIKIHFSVNSQLPSVMGDPRFSRQVVINLLSNAIKFSPAGGEIVIAARHVSGEFLDISVMDHGPGMEPALLRRLGEPFLQGNPAVSQSGHGTGLGLSICKRYMEVLGGELLIKSTVGAGTTATIRFPQSLLVAAERGVPPARAVA